MSHHHGHHGHHGHSGESHHWIGNAAGAIGGYELAKEDGKGLFGELASAAAGAYLGGEAENVLRGGSHHHHHQHQHQHHHHHHHHHQQQYGGYDQFGYSQGGYGQGGYDQFGYAQGGKGGW